MKRAAGRLRKAFVAPRENPYRVVWPIPGISEQALEAARQLRGAERDPAIMLHGVMPRSGTVYVGELLRLHPDLYAYPNDLWELPFLAQTPELAAFQRRFFSDYEQSLARMGENDFLPLFGAALLGYLHTFTPANQRPLVKEAGVDHLGRFPAVFPSEQLLLLMRDGRDLVHSTLRTWPRMDFSKVCRRWAASTRAVLEYERIHRDRDPGCWLVRYEDVQRDPAAFVREACKRFALDVQRYPFEATGQVRLIGSSTVAGEGGVDWSRHEQAPADFKPTEHWRTWPEKRKQRFKQIAGDALIAAGYATDLDW